MQSPLTSKIYFLYSREGVFPLGKENVVVIFEAHGKTFIGRGEDEHEAQLSIQRYIDKTIADHPHYPWSLEVLRVSVADIVALYNPTHIPWRESCKPTDRQGYQESV